MSTKLLKAITTFLLLFIFIYLPLQAATVTWTGNTDTDWDTGTNWDTGSEPTALDDVIIPSSLSNYPIISSIGNTVKSVKMIGNTSSLEIGIDADLTVSASLADGVSNQGTLTVNGSLDINNAGDEGLVNSGNVIVSSDGEIGIVGALGFRSFTNSGNTGEITNNGEISIAASNSSGLFNGVLTTFTNNGHLLINGDPSGGGLENFGFFTNSGTFTVSITSNPEGGAIYSESEFTNSACAKLTLNKHIDNTAGTFFDNDGILILTGSDDNFGTITNNAIIYKTNTGASINTSGAGTIYNSLNTLVWTACGGTTDWDTEKNWSLDVEPDASHNVRINSLIAGTVFPIVSSSANTSKSVVVKSSASLEIESTGILTISNSPFHGIHILGTFINDGELNIENSFQDGFRNESIDGSNGGEINISDSGDDGFLNAEESEFVNYGIITIEGSQDESGIDNKGDFLLDGDIDINTSNSPTDGSVTNSSIFEITRCGTLTVNNEIDNTNATSFTNYGAIFSTFNGINEGTIENETVIYNLNGGTFTNDPTSNGFELTGTITTVWNACNTNTSWTNVENWTTGVPNNTKDAIIPAEQNGFFPVIMTPAEVDILTIEAGAEVSNESTLDAQIIDNSGTLFNDACSYVINIFSDIINNVSGEITNTGSINLVGAATFTDNGGLYIGNAPGTSPPLNLVYVDKDATSGNNDGTSWEDAYWDLQDALTTAIGCPKEIWVAEGEYFPTSTSNRNISFHLPDGVELYGGFQGTETLRNDRDFLLYETLLSGDIGAIGDNSDNSYQVLYANYNVSVKIDGFTIADGNANEVFDEVIQNDGGGFYNLGEAIVQNCIFEYNSASDDGAAMYNGDFKNDNTKIINCIFNVNSGSYAINNRGSSLSIINTLVTGNDGGGISHNGSSSTEVLDVDNCTIAGNKGHGVYIDETSLNAVNSIFWDNEVAGLQNEFAQISTDPNATVSFSCVEGGWTGNGSTNIGADPLFTTPINPADSPTAAGDFTLQIASPAINTGNTGSLQTDVSDVDDDGNDTEIIDIDLAQNTRVQLSTLDMGAYEASESCNVESTTASWTGATDTDWNTPSNWCPYFVPTIDDNVFIGDMAATNYPVIDADVGAVKSITMTDGSLTLTVDGILDINNSNIHGINISKGTITNNGSIFIYSTIRRGINVFGSPSTVTIENNGDIHISDAGTDGIQLAFDATLNNNEGGNIFITNPAEEGLIVVSGGEFFNNTDAIISISGAGENGLTRHVSSNIYNSGDIHIEQSAPEKKLISTTTSILVTAGVGGIYNYQCASITFDNVLENNATIENDGIIHANGNLLTNTGTILQSTTGIIFDPNNLFDSPGGTFTDNGNTFPENQANSTTNIWTGCADDFDWDTPENWSLEEEPQVDYDVIITDITGGSNSPNIYTTGNVAQSIEVENGATLTIDLAGELNIDNSNENGIKNQGTITNSGILNVSNSSNNDINNTGIFNNDWCAEMTLTGQINSSNNFSNNGLLTTTFNGTNTITGTFTNNGVINDSFDSFNEGADITNNSLIILPITGCLGGSISNALIDGGSSLTVDTNWLDGIFETIGGTYNSATNTFTPDNNSIGVGTHILDISIEDLAAGCDLFTTIEVEIESCTQTWVGGSSPANTDWNDPDNWSTGSVPLPTDDVTIADIAPLTNYPIIDTDIEVYSMTIGLNASLDIASSSSLTIENGLTNNGSLTNNGVTELLDGNFDNSGTFSNQTCAVFELEEIIENAGTFTNNGILLSNTSINHQNIATTAVFTNTGIIYNNGMANPFIISGTFTDTGKTLLDSTTNIWTGCNDNTDWNIPSNWSLGMIPNLQNIIIPELTSATNYPIITNTPNAIISLVVEDASTLTLEDGAELTVENISDVGIDIEVGASFNIDSGATVNVNNAPTTGVNVDGTLNVNGDLFIIATNLGMNVGIAGTVNDEGLIEITEGLPLEKTGIISVVNFLEIQNGGTLEVKAGGNLLIDGAAPTIALVGKKIGFSDGDTGIKIFNGGILLSEATSIIEVINISGTGIDDAGEVEHSGEMVITAEDVGVTISNNFTDDGSVDISKPEGLVLQKTGTSSASVVNFLEIQNGGTLEINSGGSLTVDGADVGPVAKINIVNDDTGIDVQTGGTLTTETNSSIEVINMNGLSTGIVNNGIIDHSGIADIVIESTGIQTQSGTVENSGDINISKIEGLTLGVKNTGGASVVNFLEIQNGGTLEVKSGGTITIDGADIGPVAKTGVTNTDIGISVATGGTFMSEDNSSTEIINMTDSSKGIVNDGEIDNLGTVTITSDNIGIQINTGGTINSGGEINISKIGVDVEAPPTSDGENDNDEDIDLPSNFKSSEGASVVNFLEIQNGGTLTIPAGGSLIIDGQEGLVQKSKDSKILLNDVGISIESGGTLIAETSSNVDVINMVGASIGVRTSGTVTNDGDFDITTEGVGVEIKAGNFDNGGELDIAKIDGLTLLSQKASTGSGSVVNFLEIQNGGTLTVPAGGSLIIDGQATVAKSNKALLNDVGININTGGTLIAETNSNVDVINMTGTSIGVSTSGTVTNDGDFDITTENVGLEVKAGSFDNGGELDIAKIDGLTFLSQKASTGSGSVVNFLEIQNGGTLEIFSGGSLTVDGKATIAKTNKALSNDIGINVNTGGTLIAQDSSTVNVINMIGTSTGIMSNGSIQDAGDFNITTENIGMQVQSNSVDVMGNLNITIVDGAAKSISKKGAISVVNFLEIQNGGTLEIFSGGQVIVDGGAIAAKKKALNNDIGITVQTGGLVNTHVEANLQVKNIVGEGTGISNDGTVNNDGTINIINTGNNGLHNNEQFDNNDCAVFTVDSKVVNTMDGSVHNTGLISTTYGENGGQHENNGSIINEGIIEDPNNAFINIVGNPIVESGDGGTNNYTLFTPLYTCYGENIDNATNKPFDTNSAFDINVWYTDISLSQVAGLYVYAPEFGINRFSPNYNVLGPGVHTLYVSVESENFSNCGAQNVVLVQLTIYDLPGITPIDQEICIGDSMTAPLGVEDEGGTYTWYDQQTNGTILTTGTSYTPSVLPSVTTTYWVEASDDQGCNSDERTAVTLTVHDLPIPETMTSNVNFEFCGYEDVLLGAGNYPANYSYHWSTTATTQSITTNIAGVYTVTVSNENGCTITSSAELIDTSPIVEITDDMGICFGSFSTLDVGTYSINDTYIWSNNSTTKTIAAGQGIYTVTVSDADACTGTATTAVSLESCCIAEAGTVSITSTELCSGDDITVSTNGTEQTAIGYELYYLLVNESTGIIEAINTTGIFSNIFPNDYEVYSYVQLNTMPPIPSPVGSSNLLLSAIGTSYMGCYELSLPQEVTMPDIPSQSIVYSTTDGPTEIINIAAITIVGGTPPYSVDFTTSNNAFSTFTTIGVGVYSVSHWGNATWTFSITDNNGCENEDWIISSTDNPNINITNTVITKETCAGEENGAIDISVAGGTACIPSPDYTYTWSGPNNFTASTEDIADLAMGTYYVTISDCGGNSINNDFLVLRQPPVRGRGRGNTPCAATGNKADLSNLGGTFLKIRPNPFNYYTTIEFGIAETVLTNLSIYTLDGRKVQEIYHTIADNESLHKIHFEAKDLYPGMYLLQLTTESGEMMMEKLIVR